MVNSDSSCAAMLASRRKDLRAKLAAAASPAESARIAADALDAIRSQAIERVAVRDGRLVDTLITELRTGLHSMAGPAKATPRPGSTLAAPAAPAPILQVGLTALQLAGCAVLLAAPFQLHLVAWFVILGLAVLLAAELAIMLWQRVPTGTRAMLGTPASKPAVAAHAEPLVTLDPDTICDRLHDGLAAVDAALDERAAALQPAKPSEGLATLGDVVEYLQTIAGLASRAKGDALIHVGEQVPSVLARHGLKLRNYTPSLAPADLEAFDFEPDVTGTLRTPRSELPAVLSERGVLRRGRVVQPRSNA